MFAALPERIQRLATAAFHLFEDDPDHPSLRLHPLDDMKKGRHENGSVSVSLTGGYRAIYVVRGNVNLWYWIGSHSDYNTFAGRK
jgi:hypothetical protein